MSDLLTVTVEVREDEVHAVAGVLDMLANERRTASGAVSRSGKGEFTYKESFRQTLMSVARALRKGADEAR